MFCLICGKDEKYLGRHVKNHHDMSDKDYYDQYLNDNIHDKCKCCGNNTSFKNIYRGYKKYCSHSCRAKIELKGRVLSKESREKISNSHKTSAKKKIASKKLSKERMGKNNPMYGKTLSKKARKSISTKLKERIASGEFTPCITNSWANSRVKLEINGFDKKYRSSWEAVFQILNPICKYEKIRIKYISPEDNDWHNYIVDFVDEENKILYEIKPEALLTSLKNKAKIKSARKWSKENKYKFIIIGNTWFKENANKIDYSKYKENLYKGMKQFLTEEKKKMNLQERENLIIKRTKEIFGKNCDMVDAMEEMTAKQMNIVFEDIEDIKDDIEVSKITAREYEKIRNEDYINNKNTKK